LIMTTLPRSTMHDDQKTLKLVLSGLVASFFIIAALDLSALTREGEFNFRTKFYAGIADNRTNPIPNRDSIRVDVHNKDKDFFYVQLKDSIGIERPVYDSADKIIVISDIEGNFDGFYSFLISNKVMDKNYNWIFENGQVVFLGDFVDRGAQS